MLHFEPMTQRFHHTAIERGWLDDELTNKQMGFGDGAEGRWRARQWMREEESENILALYREQSPIGWISIQKDTGNKVNFTMFMDVEYRKWLARVAVWGLVEKYFRNGYNRVETRPLTINKPYWEFYKRYCGFYEEGKLRNDVMMNDRTYDVLVLSMVPQQWRNFKRKWKENKRGIFRRFT